MIDLHTHILPGIDDGVKTEDEAVEFARVAAADGIRTLVATPHCRDGFYANDRTAVLDGVAALRRRLASEGVGLEVVPGAEVHVAPDLVARVRDGRAPTLGDNGRTVLFELSMSQYPVELERTLFDLRVAGLVVLIAHPERIRYFQDDLARYEALIRQGAYGQITTGSILGQFGDDVRELSEDLLRRRLVHCIASDSHNVRGRPPVLSRAREAAAAWVGADWAEAMTDAVPAALLRGESPEVPPPADPPRRRGWLAGWLGKRPAR